MSDTNTHIAIILDRTGSMDPIRDDIIGGFNTFLSDQQKESGEATLTLVQFDAEDPYEVIHNYADIKNVDPLSRDTYVPRAATPLLDAIGRGINDLEHRLSKLPDAEKPGGVVFVIITDGQENASREFRRENIVKMIEEKQKSEDWQFVFLSADLDSIGDAERYGFTEGAVMSYDKDAGGTAHMMASLHGHVANYRARRTRTVGFTDEDRGKQRSEKKRKKK